MALLPFIVFNAMLFFAAACDVWRHRIPNLIPLLLAIAGLLLAAPQSLSEAASRAGAVVLVGAVASTLWLRGWIGGGDLKLLVACSVWAPLGSLPLFVLALGLASGVQGLAALALARVLGRTSLASAARSHIPYALSIAGAGVVWSVARVQM
jgi:prepilin peptidase CpaA